MTKMTKEERKWRAKDDAYVLVQAESIKADKTRRESAMREVKNMVKEKEKEVKAIKKVAKKK